MAKQEVRRGRKFVEYHDPETQDEFTFTQEISGADVSYQETDGSWHPADENWATDGVDGFILKNDKLNHKIRLKGNGGRNWYPRRNVNTEYMTFGVPQYRNGNKWSNFSFSGWSVEGKTITLNTRQGVTILVHNRWNGIKIDWVLASSSAPSRMRYPVSLTGITYVDGVIYGADGTRLGRLTPTTATDSSVDEIGQPRQLPCSGGYANGYVEFQADVTGAVHPVTIDPDFGVTSGVGGDAFIDDEDTDKRKYNYGANVKIYYHPKITTLMRFDLSTINASSTITASTLKLHMSSATDAVWSRANFYEISDANGDWVEGTKTNSLAGSGETCWNAKAADGSGGVTTAWAGSAGCATAGTDYINTVLGSIELEPSYGSNGQLVEVEFNEDGLDVIQSWFGESTNNGLLMKVNGTLDWTNFHSGESTTESYRPVLSVTYTAAGGALHRINMNAQMSNLTGGMHG